jgi:hypothetical protein
MTNIKLLCLIGYPPMYPFDNTFAWLSVLDTFYLIPLLISIAHLPDFFYIHFVAFLLSGSFADKFGYVLHYLEHVFDFFLVFNIPEFLLIMHEPHLKSFLLKKQFFREVNVNFH